MNNYFTLLNEWQDAKLNVVAAKKTLMKSVLSEISFAKGAFLNSQNTTLDGLFSTWLKKISDHKKTEEEISVDFNYFKYFNVTEPIHSMLLADLLDPFANHGQRCLFLNLFLQILGIKDYQKGKWYIAPEENKIDILLKRREYRNVIIVENKSNNAIDQPNQLYRYWYYDIFLPYKNLFVEKVFSGHLPENFRIVYLVSNYWKDPADYSLTKPKELFDDDAPQAIPKDWITKIYYHHQIRTLIESALQIISPQNYRLKEYLDQYKILIMNLT